MTRTEQTGPDSGPLHAQPSAVWVIGNHHAGLRDALVAIEACGMVVARVMSVADAIAALDDFPTANTIIAEIGLDLSDPVKVLLGVLSERARNTRQSIIVSCQMPALDLVVAAIASLDVTLLCDADVADRIAALSVGLGYLTRMDESDRTADALRLLRLTDEVSRIARALADITIGNGDTRPHNLSEGLTGYRAGPAETTGQAATITVDEIRLIIRWRRRREALFDGALFADPAWDIMLDLAASRLSQADVSVSSLCIAAAVPATTALRWIKTLTEAGIINRIADPDDGRRVFMQLSDVAADKVLDYLGRAKNAGVWQF